eukprot:1149202-Pelagomonas_calceolata.AAC.2
MNVENLEPTTSRGMRSFLSQYAYRLSEGGFPLRTWSPALLAATAQEITAARKTAAALDHGKPDPLNKVAKKEKLSYRKPYSKLITAYPHLCYKLETIARWNTAARIHLNMFNASSRIVRTPTSDVPRTLWHSIGFYIRLRPACCCCAAFNYCLGLVSSQYFISINCTCCWFVFSHTVSCAGPLRDPVPAA